LIAFSQGTLDRLYRHILGNVFVDAKPLMSNESVFDASVRMAAKFWPDSNVFRDCKESLEAAKIHFAVEDAKDSPAFVEAVESMLRMVVYAQNNTAKAAVTSQRTVAPAAATTADSVPVSHTSKKGDEPEGTMVGGGGRFPTSKLSNTHRHRHTHHHFRDKRARAEKAIRDRQRMQRR